MTLRSDDTANRIDNPAAVCCLCGSQSFRRIITAPDWLMPDTTTFDVYECINCGLGETRPKLSAEDLASHYPRANYSPYNTPRRFQLPKSSIIKRLRQLNAHWRYLQLMNPTIATWVITKLLDTWPVSKWLRAKLPYEEHPGTVLDIGCADGYFLRQAYGEGWTCHGIELTPGLSDALINEGIAHIEYGRFEDVASRFNTAFDAITMSHVLEHFEDPVAVLNRCHDLISETGLLVIAIPIRSPLETHVLGKYWAGWDLPRHQSHFTQKSIAQALNQAGFRIISFSYEANSNYWIYAFNYWQQDYQKKQRFSIHTRWLQWCLKPLSVLLKLTRQSGRVVIYAKKVTL